MCDTDSNLPLTSSGTVTAPVVNGQAAGVYLQLTGWNSKPGWEYGCWASSAQRFKHWARWHDAGLQLGLTLTARLLAAGLRGRDIRRVVAGVGQ